MNRFLIIFSFFLSINLIALPYYAPLFLEIGEVMETEASEEFQEKEVKKEIDFYSSNFKFLSLIFQKENQIFFSSAFSCVSNYEQDISIPPPDFF